MREGAYLYYDGNKGTFIHSGKVTCRGFTVRGKDHFDESKKVKSSTHFYDLYPSNSSPRANKRGTKGTFENLQMIVGAGWNPTSDCAKMLDRSWENGGLLIFNERESLQIKASMGKGVTEVQKFHEMHAYQFETDDVDTSEPLDAKGIKRVQGVVGSILYYARAVDNKLYIYSSIVSK